MKKLLSILLMCIVTTAFAQKTPQSRIYDVVITRVIDGDTVAFEARWLPEPLKRELSIRVYGVDTPEKGHRAKCPAEDQRGKLATEFTNRVISESKKRQIALMSWDKYGGRVLGDVILDGKSLRAMLIERGLAREYFGEAKTSWC